MTENVEGLASEKPLMFFCFDDLDGKTVALTCPKRELRSPIAKCHSEDSVKEFPINGYLFDQNSMKRYFKYDKNKVLTSNVANIFNLLYLHSSTVLNTHYRITRKIHVAVQETIKGGSLWNIFMLLLMENFT